MEPITTKHLQEMTDKNQLFYVHVTTELINVKAMLEVLLALEQVKLVERGASHDQARQEVFSQLSEHQKRIATETAAFLKQFEPQSYRETPKSNPNP
jgi:ABC-type microcin C transport system duplicated ATPase subunit YejF